MYSLLPTNDLKFFCTVTAPATSDGNGLAGSSSSD